MMRCNAMRSDGCDEMRCDGCDVMGHDGRGCRILAVLKVVGWTKKLFERILERNGKKNGRPPKANDCQKNQNFGNFMGPVCGSNIGNGTKKTTMQHCCPHVYHVQET